MGSEVLKKGVQKPRAIERVVRFSDSFGYREITLKSDTEPAIIAVRNQVAQESRADVTTQDAVKGDTQTNGLIETAVMQLQSDQVLHREFHARTVVLPWLVERAGNVQARCQNRRDVRPPFEGLHGERPHQEFVPFGDGENVLVRHISTDSVSRMNSRYKFGTWLGTRNNSAHCFLGTL